MIGNCLNFRVNILWDTLTKKLYHSGFSVTHDGKAWQTDIKWTQERVTAGWKGYKNQGELIVQQFTGLLDKNKKKIFEGDIVKFNGSNKRYHWRVIWDETDAGFKLADSCDDGYWVLLSESTGGVTGIQVIGNIFENTKPI